MACKILPSEGRRSVFAPHPRRGTTRNNAFTFIGGHAFHHKAGELHVLNKIGFFLVEGDTNGDGKADFQIKVLGSQPTLHDFFL